MKRILATLALTGVLAVSALAGEIPTCNCKAVTSEVPTAGTRIPVRDQMPAEDSWTESDIESSLLTVLLTLVSLIPR